MTSKYHCFIGGDYESHYFFGSFIALSGIAEHMINYEQDCQVVFEPCRVLKNEWIEIYTIDKHGDIKLYRKIEGNKEFAEFCKEVGVELPEVEPDPEPESEPEPEPVRPGVHLPKGGYISHKMSTRRKNRSVNAAANREVINSLQEIGLPEVAKGFIWLGADGRSSVFDHPMSNFYNLAPALLRKLDDMLAPYLVKVRDGLADHYKEHASFVITFLDYDEPKTKLHPAVTLNDVIEAINLAIESRKHE